MKGIFSSAPLFLFLLLLLVLAVSSYLGESAQLTTEGFIQFSGNSPLMGVVDVADYSVGTAKNTAIKLYDNMYFDPKNANLVEIGGGIMTKGNAEPTGISIKTITAYDRDGGKHGPYDVASGNDVPESAITKITPSYSIYMVSSDLTDTKPLVLYASWSSDTFIHVFDLSTNKAPTSVLSAYLPINSTVKTRYFAWNSAASSLANSNTLVLSDIGTSSVADGNDGRRIAVNLYDPSKTPFQLCKQIYYDHTNGNLIFGLDDGSISVYSRPFTASSYSDPPPQSFTSKSPMTGSEKTITTSGYYPMLATHPNNRFSVYYIVNGANTILVVLANRGGVLSIVYSYFYQADGSRIMTKGQIVIDPGPSSSSGTSSSSSSSSSSGSGSSGTDSANSLSDYYNWLAFWTTVAGAKDKESVFKASNYIPKTAVVPPVCPSCAYCSGGRCGGGVCTNCGGQGGNGTSGGYRFADYLVKFGSGTKDLVEDAGSGATNLVRDAGSGATNLVRDAGAAGLGVLAVGAGLGVGAVQGGVGLAKETVGGAVGLAKETVGGTIGLAREAGSGVVGALKSHPMEIRERREDSDSRRQDGAEYPDRDGRGGRGTYTLPNAPLGQSGIDPYSYNGALVSKGGNYIPITSDFSAFGK